MKRSNRVFDRCIDYLAGKNCLLSERPALDHKVSTWWYARWMLPPTMQRIASMLHFDKNLVHSRPYGLSVPTPITHICIWRHFADVTTYLLLDRAMRRLCFGTPTMGNTAPSPFALFVFLRHQHAYICPSALLRYIPEGDSSLLLFLHLLGS